MKKYKIQTWNPKNSHPCVPFIKLPIKIVSLKKKD